MGAHDLSRPTALQLAVRMEEQIQRDRMAAGARFLGADDAARRFGVRKAVANQALQILAHRGLIVRKPRLGAVVAARPVATPDLARIVIVTQVDYRDAEAQQEGAVISGLQSVFPGADVQMQTLAGPDAENQMDGLIRDALKSEVRSGIILIRGSLSVQLKLAASGLPSVVYGSAWPGVKLSSINLDNAAIATLLARALFETGSDRLLLLRRDRASPGENALLQGTIDATRELDWPLEVLELPDSRKTAQSVLQDYGRTGGPKWAVLAATPMLARTACKAMPRRPVACGSIHPVTGHPRVLRCETELGFQQHGTLLGELLRESDAPTRAHELACRLNPQSTNSHHETP